MRRTTLVIAALLALAACREEVQAERPAPVAITEETLGHYCQMNLSEHPGPKAQVHLDGLPEPLFFSQVRDAIAYQRMPEQSHRITAVYVSDMGAAQSWAEPGAENWVAADAAHYVVGSAIIGGMGAPELVPFTGRSAAEAFVRQHGGAILGLTEIDDAEVLAPVEFTLDAEGNFLPPEGHSRH
jgi:copper chaperone NosL